MPESFIQVKDHGPLRVIHLCRAPVNVLHPPMMAELQTALDGAAADARVRAVLLSGEGERVFSAGVSVGDHSRELVASAMQSFHRLLHTLLNFPLPCAAAVHGAALGGGCELALACDVILSTPQAKWGQPEIKLGSVPMPGILLLQGRLPPNVIAEWVLGGEPVSGVEAHRLGVVNQLLPEDGFFQACRDSMERYTRMSRPVLTVAKRALNQARLQRFDGGIGLLEQLYLNDLLPLADAEEGLVAFAEKRPAVWQHR